MTAETAEAAEKKMPRTLGVLCVLCGKKWPANCEHKLSTGLERRR